MASEPKNYTIVKRLVLTNIQATKKKVEFLNYKLRFIR